MRRGRCLKTSGREPFHPGPVDRNTIGISAGTAGRAAVLAVCALLIQALTFGHGAAHSGVRLIEGPIDGPGLYVVAGIHGDEPAGVAAAEHLARDRLTAGRLYILSPANVEGVREGSRLFASQGDLNRAFPGRPDGTLVERAAFAIFEDIRDRQPILVLDLHEASAPRGSGDDLRNALVCTRLDVVGDFVFEFLDVFGQKKDKDGFRLFASPPSGSINREVSDLLGIPVITVETSRDDPFSKRVQTQLVAVRFFLAHLGLMEEETPEAPHLLP